MLSIKIPIKLKIIFAAILVVLLPTAAFSWRETNTVSPQTQFARLSTSEQTAFYDRSARTLPAGTVVKINQPILFLANLRTTTIGQCSVAALSSSSQDRIFSSDLVFRKFGNQHVSMVNSFILEFSQAEVNQAVTLEIYCSVFSNRANGRISIGDLMYQLWPALSIHSIPTTRNY